MHKSCEKCSYNLDKGGFCSMAAKEIPLIKECPMGYWKLGLVEKSLNLFRSVVNHVANGLEKTPDNIKEIRLEICRGCNRYNKDLESCEECGCFVSIKTGWASEECPLKKWMRVEKSKNAEITREQNSLNDDTKEKGCGVCKKMRGVQ